MADNVYDNIKIQFEQFLLLVGNVLAHEKEINIIQNKLRRHFNTTSASYLCSTDFRSFFNHIHHLFNENLKSTKYFTILASFDEQLKKNSIKLSGSHRSSTKVPSSTHNIESVKTASSSDEKTIITSCKSSITIPFKSSSFSTNEHNISTSSIKQTTDQPLDSSDNIFSALNEFQMPKTNEESECDTKRKKKIRKLEKRLSNLSKTIRKLEETDLSLNEMQHSDLYIVESNLKKQACEVYTTLAELKKQSSSVERIIDQPVTLKELETGHPSINKALEDMVNQTQCLPSFDDVVDTVEKANEKYKLNLSIDTRKTLAEKSFKIIGKKIKNRRMADFNDIMNSRLPENFDIERNDPALNSVEIENTLLENERTAAIETEKIFEEFSRIDPDPETESNIESSDESTVESDDEEKGEEDEVESDAVVELFDGKPDGTQYDIVDILPPFSSRSSSPSTSIVCETINSEDPVKATVEISLTNRTLTILSTASIPVKRATPASFFSRARKTVPEVYTISDEDDTEESQPITIRKEHKVHTIIPRRRLEEEIPANETSTKSKKCKEQTEIVILD